MSKRRLLGKDLLNNDGRVCHRPSQMAECFLFQKEWKGYFDMLTDEESGHVIKGVFAYLDGDCPSLNGRKEKFVYSAITSEIEQEACSTFIGDFLLCEDNCL